MVDIVIGSSSAGWGLPRRAAYLVMRALCLTAVLTSPWQSSFRKGVERGKSTKRLSCKVLARNTPKK